MSYCRSPTRKPNFHHPKIHIRLQSARQKRRKDHESIHKYVRRSTGRSYGVKQSIPGDGSRNRPKGIQSFPHGDHRLHTGMLYICAEHYGVPV